MKAMMSWPRCKAFHWTLFVVSLLVVCSAILLHVRLHSKNECQMTYMWRGLQFLPVAVKDRHNVSYKYSMIVYNEGYATENVSRLYNDQIPVLFIPGSGGSARQVRSIASVMLNKTESRRKRYRYRFFAVDFDDQFSFARGEVLATQRNFVVDALRTIRSIAGDKRKIVLVGHSLGGTLAMSILSHPEFKIGWVDLIITKSAPLVHCPMYMDSEMQKIYEEMKQFWAKERDGKLKKVGFVSYSSGLKDFVVADGLTAIDKVVHRPAWAVPGVPDVGADHLCVLWCNMLVRHATRILEQYAISYFSRNATGREVVDAFFALESKRRLKSLEYSPDPPEAATLQLGDTINDQLENTTLEYSFSLAMTETAFIEVESKCIRFVSALHSSGLIHKKGIRYAKGEMKISRLALYRMIPNTRTRILLGGPEKCEFTLRVTSSIFVSLWKWYEAPFMNPHLFFSSLLLFCIRFAILERLANVGVDYNWESASALITGLVCLLTTTSHLASALPIVLALMVVYTFWSAAHLVQKLTAMLSFNILSFVPKMLWICAALLTNFFNPALSIVLLIFYQAQKISLRGVFLAVPFIVQMAAIAFYTKTHLLSNAHSATFLTSLFCIAVTSFIGNFQFSLNKTFCKLQLSFLLVCSLLLEHANLPLQTISLASCVIFTVLPQLKLSHTHID